MVNSVLTQTIKVLQNKISVKLNLPSSPAQHW